MKIATISGSVRSGSTTAAFLRSLDSFFPKITFNYIDISNIPLFHPDINDLEISHEVLAFKKKITASDAVIIATPSYLHNIPAVLKNALEWTAKSGEFAHKKLLPITYTPSEGRGEQAMKSLIYTLQALDTQIVARMELCHPGLNNNEENDAIEMIKEAISLII